ncbi:MAG: hypothetical protein IJ015_00810 [Ruminococcus sp.]|nr:hypothetical protein [Ruminococcus sp.]
MKKMLCLLLDLVLIASVFSITALATENETSREDDASKDEFVSFSNSGVCDDGYIPNFSVEE